MRSQQILMDRGLFDPRLVDQVYEHCGQAERKLRAGIAWGIHDFAM